MGLLCVLVCAAAPAQNSYFGFDQDEYPGDQSLPALRRSFSYTGYWLSNPPGDTHNTWTGKRALLKASGFGFMLLYNGRLDAQLKGQDAAALGRADAAAAVAAAQTEGFAPGAVIFLDQEEGGRLLPEQSAYVFAWIEAIEAFKYRPGVYCSGIAVAEGASSITTAEQIRSHHGSVALWVFNDACPPAPGCRIQKAAKESGTRDALVWQYARSPRTDFARRCGGYAADNNCYPPGLPHNAQTLLDLDLSTSPDPSKTR